MSPSTNVLRHLSVSRRAMKEIIYIQAGSCANYVGTHFWNTQEYYLGRTRVEDPTISFSERLSDKGQPTYYPRVLIFDRRDNFGTLSQATSHTGPNEDDFFLEDAPEIWTGRITEYRHERIPKSAYHTKIDNENLPDDESHDLDFAADDASENIRCWSDFSRVYYTPRSIQRLPQISNVEPQLEGWAAGQRIFAHHDQETDLMEESFRLFFEECDSPQGIQVINDTTVFGGFMHSLLTTFRDDHPKLPCLVFPLISGGTPWHIAPTDQHSPPKMVNDALYLRGLNELASLSVPVNHSSTWPVNAWNKDLLDAKHGSAYHASAILSPHIETVTFPLRSKNGTEDLRSLCSRLNWRGSTPFAELSGVFPVGSEFDDGRIARFSTLAQKSGLDNMDYVRIDVTRGLLPRQLTSYNAWNTSHPNQTSLGLSVHAPLYPLPTSFPAFFRSSVDYSWTSDPHTRGPLTRPREISMFSSLSSSTSISQNFSAYAMAIEDFLKRHSNLENMDLNADDLRELASDLWTMHDNAGGEVSSFDVDE